MKASSKYKLGLIACMAVIVVLAIVPAEVHATSQDAGGLINEGMAAGLAAGAPTFGIGLILSLVRFMGKKINDANSSDASAMTPFQLHMFLATGLVGFIAGVVLNAFNAPNNIQSGVAVILTYFFTQLAPAFKNVSWFSHKTVSNGVAAAKKI